MLIYTPLSLYRFDGHLYVAGTVAWLIIITLGIIWHNWICPKVMMYFLFSQMTKNLKKRDDRWNVFHKMNVPVCRQMVLFAAIAGMAAAQPIVILGWVIEIPGYINILNVVWSFFVGALWVYRAVYQNYYTQRSEAIKNVIKYEVLSITLLILSFAVAGIIAGAILSYRSS
jgi:hypothetical protein